MVESNQNGLLEFTYKMSNIVKITPIEESDYSDLSFMVGELLNEIMKKIKHKAFNYNQVETVKKIKELVSAEKYWVFIAKNRESGENIGFVSLYESYALYSEGAYGTMPELYVRPHWRSKNVGNELLNRVSKFAKSKNWQRIEVTTPPLPEFNRTIEFYQSNGFEITGGKKLKINI